MSEKCPTRESSVRRFARWARLTAGAVLLTWAPTVFVALARAEETTGPADAAKPWLQWLLAFAFGGLCCGIAFKNPKRSHMD